MVFERAFVDLGFNIIDRNVSSSRGRRARGVPGKQLPDIDFVVEKNGLLFGADVKNWIRYEKSSIYEIISKVNIAFQLHLIPIIFARYVDKDTIFNELRLKGVKYYIFKHLLIPEHYSKLAEEATKLLGYPILNCNRLTEEKIQFLREKVLNF